MNTSNATTRGNGVRDDDNPVSSESTTQALRDMFAGTFQHLDGWVDTMHKIETQARKHPVALIAAGAGVVLAVASGITLGVLENKRRNTFAYKLSKGMKWAMNMF